MAKKKKEVDILDILPVEAIAEVDKLGYTFLQGLGYDVDGAEESKEKREKLKEAMKKRGDELRYARAVDKNQGAILVWYELWKGGERKAISQGLKFVQKPREGGENGAGEDTQNQERLAAASEDNS